MTTDSFYCPPERIAGDRLVIDGEEFSHLVHVMRKKEGDEIVAVDGRGNAYEAVIDRIERRTALCRIAGRLARWREPDLRVVLAAGVLKNPSRYDFLVEKATELGVTEIIPMRTARTIPSHARSDRWRKLALAAMKQSGRSWLPEVRDLSAFGDVLDEFRNCENRVVAHEDPAAGTPFRELRPPTGEGTGLLLMVGPEGGFTGEEIAECAGAGFTTLYLGERRLRTETAAVVALARLMR
ncbi:MAG TPA: RsmE family RNA methyltransferase [Bacteroidota bacterium]|nr:RsmE family RNA methyltransferase [Bacteroidota bacterium]